MKTNQIFTAAFFLFAALFSTAATQAQSVDSDIDLDDGVLKIEGDWTIDFIYVWHDGDEIEVRIDQYRDWSEYGDEDPARTRTRDYDIEDVDSIEISSLGGRDAIQSFYVPPHVPVTIDSGDGGDWIDFVGDGPLVAYCGPGDDYVHTSDVVVSVGHIIDGGDGDDDLNSGGGSDWIHGGAGADRIEASSGDDIVIGGDGPDYIKGGAGNDDLFGYDGNDKILGGSGDDYLDGGLGDDDLTGDYDAYGKLADGGTDYLYGRAGNDTLRCDYDGKVDTLFGDQGADDLIYRVYSKRLITSGRGQTIDIRNLQYKTTVWEIDLTPDVDLAEGDRLVSRKK